VQKRVGVHGVVARAEVVGAVVVDGIDVLGRDEVVDVDQARLRAGRGGQLVVGQLDPLAALDL
jgi:hypothetical protein